ncbi:MAG: Hpt domain-containing protein [Thermodesulfobacteriota bacterium]
MMTTSSVEGGKPGMTDVRWDRAFALEQAGDDEELLQELIELFHESSAVDAGRIRQCMEDEALREAADAAHSIKGAAASLGIEGVRAVAADLEQAGRLGDRVLMEELLGRLDAALGEFRSVTVPG